MTLFCCSGVGGTGKTETIKALLQINPDLVFMPSVVRDFMKGLSLTEKDYFQLSRESRYEVQSELLNHYIYSTSKFNRSAQRQANSVRPFDLLSYRVLYL
jgi:hypothetical protein